MSSTKNNLAVVQNLKEITASSGTRYRAHDSLPTNHPCPDSHEPSPHQCNIFLYSRYAKHNLTWTPQGMRQVDMALITNSRNYTASIVCYVTNELMNI